MQNNIFLKEKEVFVENSQLYLKLVYQYEDNIGVRELIIPKMKLGINANITPCITTEGHYIYLDYHASYYSNKFELHRSDIVIKKNGETHLCENAAYVINTIKEKPRELTLSEIEKKLGYKIKLVSEDHKNE